MKYAPYSFSKINTFFNCQKQFEFTYVNKIDVDKEYTDPSYFVRGRFIHKYIADRLSGKSGIINGFNDMDVDDRLALIECGDVTLANEFISMTFDFDTHGIEKSIMLSGDLKPTGKDAALKGFIDYFAVKDDYGLIVDWKSGRYRPDPNYNQLELYAIWLLEKHQEITEIDLMFFYVEHNKFCIKTITRDEILLLKETIQAKIDLIEATDEFEINPSKQCYQCKFFNTCSDEFGIIV